MVVDPFSPRSRPEPSLQIPDSTPQNPVDASFPVVGVAASAGGLEAFTQLLSYLPTDTGMAFVLIQHLSPDHKSLLAEILARTTKMPVSDVQQGMVVEPNHVYVIPPNTKMILHEGMLQLSPREKILGKYMPGDAFFTSLAADRGHKAIAVVLSGGDGDGSLGLKAIKAAGGVTFAECEETAQFDSMPNTAVATGNVDFVLPPAKIAEALAALSRNPMLARPLPPSVEEAEALPEAGNAQNALATIFALLRSATGVDFSRYKSNTLNRRIGRRMLLYKLEQLEDYVAYLQSHPDEVKALYEEILIHVTSFFRDPGAFELLKERVFPAIAQKKSPDSPIRIWVAGCSTGEEVYSIAICLLEFLTDKATQPPIQIFATDISEQAIDKARSGIYTANQMVDVSAERRRRFFYTLDGDSYQISKTVRELCVFARQDLGCDPPFSNLDLISCRNVLIYLGDSLQKRIMPIFQYSLNPTGFLLLGTSESTGRYSDLFTPVDKKYRIYAKQITATRPIFSFAPSRYPAAKVIDPATLTRQPAHVEGFDLQKKTDQLIAHHYAPIGVVIDDKMQILQLRGDIDRYLRLMPGVANLNLFNLVRQGLLSELRAAIYQAQRQEIPVSKLGLSLEEESDSLGKPCHRTELANLQVIPFNVPTVAERRFLVLFEDATPIVSGLNGDDESSQGSSESNLERDLERENSRLKQELAAAIQDRAATQEYLQAVIQEQDQVTQDLKVANEEILSSNEELQSTNEELETAKEEIQATNEELHTTNDELRSRNGELNQVNNDLTNLLASINIPILMLTQDLRIRRFTPMAQQLFNFIATDAGRPLSDIRTNLDIPDLEPLISEVLDTLSVKEIEVQTQAGYWYTLRIRPYRTTDNQIDGVVLVLLDIDALKRSAVTLEAARNYAEAIVETVPVPLLVLDSDFRVSKANHAFYETFEVSPAETEQSLIFELSNHQWNILGLRSLLEDVFNHDEVVKNFELEHHFRHIGKKTMLLNALKVVETGAAQRILLAIEDISDRKLFETARADLLSEEQSARHDAESANSAKDEFLSNLSHELRNPLTAILGWAQILRTRKLDESKMAIALESIERSARAQSHLIEDILDVSRITSGKLRLNSNLLELGSVVDAAIQSIQLSADAKSIQVVTQLMPVMLMGDAVRLQQVLWNLLSNAIKFTPTGGQVNITLKSMQTDAEIRVSDTGQGIETALLPYVFERFRQGDASTSKTSQGLGLGLSIVRHIVELHGGTARAESPGQGQGTTIIVRLPLRSVPLEAIPNVAAAVEDSVAAASLEAASLEGLHILAVDDNVDSLNVMKYVLENVGAQVTTVDSAKAAIAVLTASPDSYDFLLADIGMPDEDGFSLIRQVRELEAEAGRRQIPAAAVTAYVSEQERQMAFSAGFQAHITKPVDHAQLISVIANLTS